jgi:hypothetical protein
MAIKKPVVKTTPVKRTPAKKQVAKRPVKKITTPPIEFKKPDSMVDKAIDLVKWVDTPFKLFEVIILVYV